MADSLSPNLKLRLSDDLTADARYNLNRIDGLGGATKVENNGNLRLRSVRDIILTPESQDLGGNGTGGTVSVGESGVEITAFEVFADLADFNDTPALLRFLRLAELPLNGTNYVQLQSPDSLSASFTLYLPVADGSANQVLTTDGSGQLGWANVLTDSLSENNVNVGNSSDTSTPVDTATLGDILADSSTGFTIKAGVIVDADINASANIDFDKMQALTANRALVTNLSGTVIASTVLDTELAFLSGVTSAIQTQLNNKQPLDSTLTALAGYNTNGILTQVSVDTFTGRTLTAGVGISISNGDGVAGNPSIASTITQYTDELAQDAVGTILLDTNSIDLSYNDGTPSISADLKLSAALADSGFFNAVASIETDGLQVQVQKSDVQAVIDSGSFAANWVTADGTSKSITHNLNSRDVMIQVYDAATFETIYTDTAIRTTLNAVDLTATQAPSSTWRVLIRKV